jgi:hypothetical protein
MNNVHNKVVWKIQENQTSRFIGMHIAQQMFFSPFFFAFVLLKGMSTNIGAKNHVG